MVPGRTHSGQDTLPWQGAITLTQMGTCSHTNSPDCTSLGRGRKPESTEKTHADMRRTCPLSTDRGPGCKSTFLSHQCYNATIWTKQRYVREDLLYLVVTLVPMLERTGNFSVPAGDTFCEKGPRYSAMGRVIILLLSVHRLSAFLEKLKKIQIFMWNFYILKYSNESKWTSLREPRKKSPWWTGFWVATSKLWAGQSCPSSELVCCKSRAARSLGKALVIILLLQRARLDSWGRSQGEVWFSSVWGWIIDAQKLLSNYLI